MDLEETEAKNYQQFNRPNDLVESVDSRVRSGKLVAETRESSRT
jgi:hypothetical protein